jgi:hypothetical protein
MNTVPKFYKEEDKEVVAIERRNQTGKQPC